MKLNWLTVAHRIEHNKSVIMYKCVNNLMPQYMYDMFNKQTSSRYTLRSETHENLVIPKAKTELFKQRLQYSGPKLWNLLPPPLRNSETLATFKKDFKKWYRFHIKCSSCHLVHSVYINVHLSVSVVVVVLLAFLVCLIENCIMFYVSCICIFMYK